MICIGFMLPFVVSQAAAKEPTAKQILERASRNYDAVRDYIVDARLTIQSPSIHIPETQVKIYFKKPDKLHVESRDGFAVLPKQGVIVGSPLRGLADGSALSLAGSEKTLGRDCCVIKVTSQQEGRVVQSTVWIDKRDWLVRQIQANPEWGPSIKVKLWYSKVAGRYWLPATTTAQISLPPIPGGESGNEAKSAQPMVVTIKFANYKVNAGLDDKIFQKHEGSR